MSANPPLQAVGDVRNLLRPLADLLVSLGVKYSDAQELLKEAFVHAAANQITQNEGARSISVVSVVSGVHRREVKRLLSQDPLPTKPASSTASLVFAQWTTNPRYLDQYGKPLSLPRTTKDRSPSFDELAQSITKDVRPRSVLDDLMRLRLVHADGECVSLSSKAFIPTADKSQLASLISMNLSDHIRAAAANMTENRFLEQSIFADELSEISAKKISAKMLRKVCTTHFQCGNGLDAEVATADCEGREPDVRIGWSGLAPLGINIDAATQALQRLMLQSPATCVVPTTDWPAPSAS